MSKFLILSLVFCAAIMLEGCSKSENPIDNSGPRSFQIGGDWEVQSATVDGLSTTLTDLPHRPATTWTEVMLLGGESYAIIDYDRDTVTIYHEEGTFSIDAQNVTFTVKTVNGKPLDTSEQRSGQWAATAQNLYLTINDGGKVLNIECIHYHNSSDGLWDY